MKRPGLACLARGGQPQIQREGERIASRTAMRPEDKYLDNAGNRYLVPNYDALVAGRPVGGDGLSQVIDPRAMRGFADGGEVEGWGGVDPWGGNVADAISQGMADLNAMGWGGGGDQGGMITDPNDPAAQYEPGMVSFDPEQSYQEWAATEGQNYDAFGNYVGGSDVTGSSSVGGFGMFGSTLGGPLSSGLPSAGMSAPTASMPQDAAKAGAPASGPSFDENGIPQTAPTESVLASLSMSLDMPYASQPEDSQRDPYADAMGPIAAGHFGIDGVVGGGVPSAPSYEVPGYVGATSPAPNAPAMDWQDFAPDVRGMPSMAAFGTTPYGGGALGPMSQKDAFLAGFMPGAVGASRATGIESRIIGAQGAHESAWGRSPSGQNNQLGMKGPGTQVATHEYVNGQRVNMTDSFRDFSSPAKQFEFYSELMSRPAFADIGRQKTYEGQIEALDDSPYATDPRYGDKVDRLASSINPGLYDLAIRDIGSNYGAMGRAMRENAVPEFGGLVSSPAQPNAPSAPASAGLMMNMGYAPQVDAMSDVIGSMMTSAPRSSAPSSYNTDYEATPSFVQGTPFASPLMDAAVSPFGHAGPQAPDTIGRGVGGSPFGYAGTSSFDAAMRSMGPQYGIMTNDIPTHDLPAGLPSFVGADMARAFDPAAFSGPALGGTIGAQAPGPMIDDRQVESYGFAGQAVGANERQATSGTSKPETFAGTGGSAARGMQLADDLTSPIEVPSLKVASVDPDVTEEDTQTAPSSRSSTSTRAVDPLTGKSYNPQTGYTYLAEPRTIARVLDAVVSPVPMLGPLNMLGSMFGYSIGNGMAKGVPADPRDPIAYGGAGADSRDAQYLAASQPFAPPASPQTATTAALGIPVNADWARRNYLGVSDPRRYGLNPQQTMFAARGGLASLRGK
jgi:hypothetical protein